MSTRIKDLAVSERPRERLARLGPAALSKTELLAVVLGSGDRRGGVLDVAQAVLRQGSVESFGYDVLLGVRGIGPAGAARIAAAIEFGRRLLLEDDERAPVRGPDDVAAFVHAHLAGRAEERVIVLLLDGRHRLRGVHEIYRGTQNGARVRTSEILRPAVAHNAPALIVAHNHPSGDPEPSAADVELTRQLASAAQGLDIELVDHVVLGGNQLVSLRARGVLGAQMARTRRGDT